MVAARRGELLTLTPYQFIGRPAVRRRGRSFGRPPKPMRSQLRARSTEIPVGASFRSPGTSQRRMTRDSAPTSDPSGRRAPRSRDRSRIQRIRLRHRTAPDAHASRRTGAAPVTRSTIAVTRPTAHAPATVQLDRARSEPESTWRRVLSHICGLTCSGGPQQSMAFSSAACRSSNGTERCSCALRAPVRAARCSAGRRSGSSRSRPNRGPTTGSGSRSQARRDRAQERRPQRRSRTH